MNDARRLWHQLEIVHAVTYFASESGDGLRQTGLRGFWMGYFAARAAPLGAVSPATVTAIFFNFHPAMVRRAVPDAWSFAAPQAVLRARGSTAASALRRMSVRGEDALAVAEALLDGAAAAPDAGRPLFAANRALPRPEDPVEALWQAATTLREHRGDGHVALLTALGLDGCEAHVLATAWKGIPDSVILENRGWSREHWTAATRRMQQRGWLRAAGELTEVGRAIRAELEARTDELASTAFATVDVELISSRLAPIAGCVLDAAVIPFPNPIGLPLDPAHP